VCKRDDITTIWQENGALRLVNKMPSFSTHPVTNKQIWCNHSQTFHPSQAFGEYKRIASSTGKLWQWFLTFVLLLLQLLKNTFTKPEDQGMNTLYGDKTPISWSDMEAVRNAIWKNIVVYPWKKGDVIMIDNRRISHGRLPYTGPRSVIVAWG
jgi:hypothetical protein